MAACTFRVGTADTGVTPNTSGAFTPAVDDLLVVLSNISATTDTSWGVTNTEGITFTQVAFTASFGGDQKIFVHVADSLVAAAVSQTVTMSEPADEGTGSSIFVYSLSGMTQTGLAAVRQSAVNPTVAAATTPNVTFASACLTANPILLILANETNPAGITPPTDWTEPGGGDLGYINPTAGAAVAHRDSGFTGTTVTWGSNSATVHGEIGVEFNAGAVVGGVGIRRQAAARSRGFGQEGVNVFREIFAKHRSGLLVPAWSR